MTNDYSIIGKSVAMIDAAEKTTGSGKYADDLSLPGMLYGKILHSPYPHARIKKYNRVITDLEAAGQGKPKGRLHHVASRQEDGSFVVTDVWASAELLAEFGKTLIPILKNAGVTPVEPHFHPVHNVIEG